MGQNIQPNSQSLAGVRLFQDLDQRERAAVAERCRGRTYGPGETVIEANDPGNDVYFVVSGLVRVQLFSSNGVNVIYRDIEAGGALGELAAIDGAPRSATIRTLENSTLLHLSAEDFWWVLAEFPAVRDATLKRLTGLVRSLTDTMFRIVTLDVRQRVQAEVVRLARTHMTDSNKAKVCPFPKHQDIADRVGTHREAVTRTLSALSKEGLIARRERCLVVPDVSALERRVQASLGL